MRNFRQSVKGRIAAAVALSILWLGWLPEFVARASPQEPKTTEQLKEFAVSKARITDFARKLTRATGLRICVEEARHFPARRDPEAVVADLNARRERGLNIQVDRGTVYDALDRLVEIDPRYTWNHDSHTNTINVYPVENAPLGWMTPPLDADERRVLEVLVTEDLLALRKKGVSFVPRGRVTWLETRVSLVSPPLTAREALNRLCAQLDFHARWEVYETTTPQGEIRYMLMIHGAYREGMRPLPKKVHNGEQED